MQRLRSFAEPVGLDKISRGRVLETSGLREGLEGGLSEGFGGGGGGFGVWSVAELAEGGGGDGAYGDEQSREWE